MRALSRRESNTKRMRPEPTTSQMYETITESMVSPWEDPPTGTVGGHQALGQGRVPVGGKVCTADQELAYCKSSSRAASTTATSFAAAFFARFPSGAFSWCSASLVTAVGILFGAVFFIIIII